MNFRLFIINLFFILFSTNCNSQSETIMLNKNKLFIAGSTITLSLASTYYYVENSWWADNKTAFHFDDGVDLIYAKNIDKLGHFMGGLFEIINVVVRNEQEKIIVIWNDCWN